MKDLPREVYWYGKNEKLTDPIPLQTMPVSLKYEAGTIRNIKHRGFEIIRMIYFAVRDHNWGTIHSTIENQTCKVNSDSFCITYERLFHSGPIHIKFDAKIKGNKNGKIEFDIEGEALSDFWTNRIGFCILHPIKEYRGKPCEILTQDGSREISFFPELISPHQPMKNIREMSWNLDELGKAKLRFEGEVFEMEDQRNWTDDSYKTYCRPLEQPFPIEIKKGEKIHQKVTFNIELNNKIETYEEVSYHLQYDVDDQIELPKIGTGKSRITRQLDGKETELLSNLNLDYYEVELDFDSMWQEELDQAVREAGNLGCQVSIKAYFGSNYLDELSALESHISDTEKIISSILILSKHSDLPSNQCINDVYSRLKRLFPHITIGSGTNGFFTELNRNRILNDKLDFISYSINPQVHAFDNLTLVENLHGQSETVKSAKSMTKGKAIHIKPVTLKMQVNPYATSGEDYESIILSKIDVRQMSLFGAAWTLGSLKNLIQSGANAITYYEAVGEKGIIQGNLIPKHPHFQAKESSVFPLYYVMKEILKDKSAKFIRSSSSHPTVFEGVILYSEGKKSLILVNFTGNPINVRVDGISHNALVKKLDEKSISKAMNDAKEYLEFPFCDFKIEHPATIKIRPYGIVFINEKLNPY